MGALIVLTDGADNSELDPLAKARNFGSRDIPIFTVGIGQEQIPQDIGIVDVNAAKTVLEGSVFNVSVGINHEGYTGERATHGVGSGVLERATEPLCPSERHSERVTRASRASYPIRKRA